MKIALSPQDQVIRKRAAVLSVLMHVLLFLGMIFMVDWKAVHVNPSVMDFRVKRCANVGATKEKKGRVFSARTSDPHGIVTFFLGLYNSRCFVSIIDFNSRVGKAWPWTMTSLSWIRTT